ncbi:MAG: hypothetical protein JST50_04855 [Bacteroidetes bacterium]|jgi:ligand-binding sensor domain-containing protein/two-component sensor histidine kinase|nr:hypothetical protein [Bacteroidota bacterium]
MSIRAKKLLCLLGLIATSCIAYAQTTPFAFSHFTLDNNLYAHVLMRDSKGYLWIGSDGLFRYDGVNLKHFIHDPKNNNSLVSDIVKSIIEDKKGRIWIGAIKGISCYDPATDSFTNYEYISDNPKNRNALFDNVLFTDAGDTLWCGNQSGISRFDDQKKQFILYDVAKHQLPGHKKGIFITGIIDDKKNKGWLWLSSYDGLVHFNKKTGFSRYYYPDGPPITMNNLFQDSHDRLWLATWGSGLGYFNEYSGQFSFSLFEQDYHFGTDNIVFNIQEDVKGKDSSLFFVSTNKGLCLPDLHDPANIHFKYFYSHVPDDPKSIGSIPSQTLIDKQGITWVATDKDVSYILPSTQVFKQVNSTHSQSALINSITEEKLDGGHYQYWLSCWYTDGPVLCDENFLPKQKVQLHRGYGKNANSRQINQIVIDPETRDVWIATMDGLYKWNRAKNTIKTYYPDKSNPLSLPSEHVMCLLLDHQKRLWLGTYHSGFVSMNILNDSFIKIPSQIQNTAKDRRVFCMYEDSKQRTWLGCAGALFMMNGKTGKWQVYEHQKNNNKSKAAGDVNGIAEDKNGNIWIGNDEGLNRYNEKTKDFDLFTTADGLSNDHIYNIVCDKAGILWAGTTNGLNSIDPATNIIKSFYEKDGLSLNDQSNAIMIKSDNEIATAGAKGTVTLFDPAKLYRNSTPPPVYITSLKLFNKQDKRQSYFPSPKEINLSYDENYFSIDFIALNLMNPGDNKYAYELTGLDKNWIQSGSEHSVTYSNLSAGTYTFKVKAANNDGIWNNQGASLIITISPPFWKTWWFITICVVAIAVIGYGLYNYRLEQLLQVERLRTKISTDLHDDIGSTLSSISILSELVLHKKDKDQADEMLNEIKDNAISLMEKMDDIVWSINPKNDSLEDLLSRITRFASQLFEAKNIEHNITIQPDIKDLKLSMESRQHLYLMIKESINNIVKHANCTKASIAATYKDHLLNVVIDDNGKGFKTDKNRSGNGLINLKERAVKMGANVQIESVPRKGTMVAISIKIK